MAKTKYTQNCNASYVLDTKIAEKSLELLTLTKKIENLKVLIEEMESAKLSN